MPINLYISGPMTGIKNKNYEAFATATIELRTAGYDITNPWQLDKNEPEVTWEDCLRRDIKEMMLQCNGVATLPRWKKSKGAQLEVYIAKALKWPVHTVTYWRKKCRTSIKA